MSVSSAVTRPVIRVSRTNVVNGSVAVGAPTHTDCDPVRYQRFEPLPFSMHDAARAQASRLAMSGYDPAMGKR